METITAMADRVLRAPGTRSSVTKQLRAQVLTALIGCKWHWDRMCTPLTREHWELYDIIHRAHWRRLQRFPDLRSCREYNDKIQWLKLFDQSQEVIDCADKLAVRDYVTNRVGARYLVPILQTCKTFEEIDFPALPRSFVIKVNNDSGNVVLVRDKQALDLNVAREKINYSLGRVYGWNGGEWEYAFIVPKILIEEFIEPDSVSPPADYKFHCVNGRIRWLQYIFDRGSDTKEVIVDPAGLVTDIHFDRHMTHATRFEKPAEWETLCEVAERLAAGWKYVRVDLYLSRGCIKFGEITIYPLAGCYPGDGQIELGKLMDFDRKTVKPPIYCHLTQATRPGLSQK
jgi:hypothetical protein